MPKGSSERATHTILAKLERLSNGQYVARSNWSDVVMPSQISQGRSEIENLSNLFEINPLSTDNKYLNPRERLQQSQMREWGGGLSPSIRTTSPENEEEIYGNVSGPSDLGIEFIKNYEGVNLNVYDAGDGFRTIGYGHVILPSENIPDSISKEYADELFQNDISLKRSESLDDFIKQYSIKLTQNQYDALLSFTFNVGGYKWDENPKDFKLKSLLINGNYTKEEIAEAMLRYDLVGDKKNAGLYRRRMDEIEMFNEGDYKRKDWSLPAEYQ